MKITDPQPAQYASSRNLAARAGLVQKYATRDWFGMVAGALPLTEGDAVLDIGCGAAWFWQTQAARLPKVRLTLADRSPGMVDEALRNVAGRFEATGLVADARDLPPSVQDQDLILAMHMLYHLPDPDAAIVGFRDRLKPGGWLAVTVNARGNMAPLWQISARVFGHAPIDPAVEAFDDQRAADCLRRHFGAAEVLAFADELTVSDAEDIEAFYASMPWAANGSAAERAQLTAEVTSAMADGPLHLPCRSALIVTAWPG